MSPSEKPGKRAPRRDSFASLNALVATSEIALVATTEQDELNASEQYPQSLAGAGRLHAMEPQVATTLDVERVLADRSLRIAFQPVCALRSREIIGYEALARFPGEVITTPRQWFHQALQLGLLQALELLAASTALEELASLEEQAFLAINVSPATAASKAFGELVSTVPPERLVLEITENATMENYRRFTGAIDHLRSVGVRIALDDAGAADVSLQHLLGVRPDIVKIDTTVIHGIAEDEVRQAVAYAYANMAKRAGAVSLAEGIETEKELAMLVSLEVETGQGYLLGRPAFRGD
jgi:EAL domain-containing protein (putative c-di-GMP-specific phosphodiesterase class I)